MRSSLYLALPLMFLLTIVQASVLPRFPILGLVPQLVLLAAVAWGLLRDVSEGALWAFWAGFFLDLFSASPMGVSSLAAMTAVSVVTLLQERLPPSRFFIPLLLMALATIIFQFVYIIVLRLAGYPVNVQVAAQLLPTAVLHALLMIPVFWLMSALNQLFWPRRIEL